MKHTMRMTNSVESANWKKVRLTSHPNHTTNSIITPAMFNRECKEYDEGTLIVHHDLYLGER